MNRTVIRFCLKGSSSIHAIIVQECVLFDNYRKWRYFWYFWIVKGIVPVHGWRYMWSGGTVPCVLKFGARRRWKINFALWLFFPWERGLSAHWMGSWLPLTYGLDSWESNHDLYVIQPAASSLNKLSYFSSIIEELGSRKHRVPSIKEFWHQNF